METSNRFKWAAVAVAPYGVTVGVCVSRACALERVERLFLPHWERLHGRKVDQLFSLQVAGDGSARAGRCYHLLYDGPAQIARSLDFDEILQALEGELHLRVGATAPDRVFVHAGVVGWRGRAIVLPGRSMTGKSRLVHELVARGATYYSDEYAVIDPRGYVHPYPRALALRDPVRRIAGDLLTGGRAFPPLPVGLVLQTRYWPGTTGFSPRRASPRATMMGLLANALSVVPNPKLNMSVLGLVAAQAESLAGPRPDAHLVAGKLLIMASMPLK